MFSLSGERTSGRQAVAPPIVENIRRLRGEPSEEKKTQVCAGRGGGGGGMTAVFGSKFIFRRETKMYTYSLLSSAQQTLSLCLAGTGC